MSDTENKSRLDIDINVDCDTVLMEVQELWDTLQALRAENASLKE